MVEPRHLQLEVVRPTLLLLEMWSPVAEALVMGTAAQESNFKYLRQLGTGPALGLFQMEPTTHDDIWKNYLQFKPEIKAKLAEFVPVKSSLEVPPSRNLTGNLFYAAAMCRLHYFRNRERLPDEVKVWDLGGYWKRVYNTPLGKGTVEEFEENWKRYRLSELEFNH